jgi:hypothetical protein
MRVSPSYGGAYFQSSHTKVTARSWGLFTFKLSIAKQEKKTEYRMNSRQILKYSEAYLNFSDLLFDKNLASKVGP